MNKVVTIKKHEGEKRTRARKKIADSDGGRFGLKNMRLASKLGLLVGLLILVSVIISTLAVSRLRELNATIGLMDEAAMKVELAAEMQDHAMQAVRVEKNIILARTKADKAQWEASFNKAVEGMREPMGKLAKNADEMDKKGLAEFDEKWNTYEANARKIIALAKEYGTDDLATGVANQEQREKFVVSIKLTQETGKALVGDLEGVIQRMVEDFEQELEEHKAASNSIFNATMLVITITAVVGVSLGLLMAIIISRAITTPVNQTVEVIKEIAAGDFSRDVPVDGKDEIAELGNAVNDMVFELRGIFTGLGKYSKGLATSSEELSAVSTQLSASSEEMSQQSASVASATEQMSSNINSMAAAVEEASMNANTVSGTAEQMSANMYSIASSVEEMSQSIKEVAKSAEDASKVAGIAMGLSKNASDTMQTLGAAANEIGKVTEMIKRIAEQTNLLALNATIEAASAGEAGRGFAVVANEIKELANQSAHAAEEIAAKIDGVRGSTTSAVKVIADVSDIIGKINTSVGSISGAVNQQTAAANEISRNVSEVSKGAVDIASSIAEVAKGATDISRNSGEAARGANEVSSNIMGISKAVVDNNSGIRQINSSSGELAKMASSMQAMVARFKVDESDGKRGPQAKKVIAAGEDY